MNAERDVESRQRALFDRLADRYEAHYYDRWSLLYRARFFEGQEAEGIDLRGLSVLDAMCGGGSGALYLARQGAQVTALDISEEAVQNCRRRVPQATVVRASALATGFPDASFDAVFISFALHHVHPHVDEVVAEMHRIIRPGGWFCFAEPHRGSLSDLPRRLWYRVDPIFEDNEAAVDVARLERTFRDRFDPVFRHYLGGPAYLVVLNSMVFRIPLRLKRFYSPALLWLEGQLARVQGRRLSCFVVVQWRKRSG